MQSVNKCNTNDICCKCCFKLVIAICLFLHPLSFAASILIIGYPWEMAEVGWRANYASDITLVLHPSSSSEE